MNGHNNKGNNNKNRKKDYDKINLSKIITVGKHEVVSNIKRKTFIRTTLLVPIIMLLIGGSTIFLSSLTPSNLKVGYIDYYNVNIPNKVIKYNRINNENITIEFIKYNSINSGKNDVLNNSIDYFIIIPNDYLKTGNIIVYSKSKTINTYLSNTINEILLKNILKGKVDNETYMRVKNPVNYEIYQLNNNKMEKSDLMSQLMPMFFAGLLYIAIITVSSIGMSSVIEEKQNRIVEMILPFTNPNNLFIGKILGVFVLGLIQLSIWMIFVQLFNFLNIGFIFSSNIGLIVIGVIYFILSYIFYISLICGVSSLFATGKDAANVITLITFIQILPFLMSSLIKNNPDSYILKILSYIPFIESQIMLMRISVSNVSTTELILSIGVMVVSTIGAIILGIRLFRVGVLKYDGEGVLKTIKFVIFGK